MGDRGNRLVVADAGRAGELPEWLLEEVRRERLLSGLADIAKPDKEGMAGDAEVCAYLFTRSLAGPMGPKLTNVYLYLAAKLVKKAGVVPTGFMEEKLKQGLAEHEERELRELKRVLYQKRGGDIRHPVLDAMRALRREAAGGKTQKRVG